MANSAYASADELYDSATPVMFKDQKTYSGSADALSTASMRFIFGLPYQFSEIVDPRVGNGTTKSKWGAKYAEKIISRMPLLYLVPCRQEFMGGMSGSDKSAVLNALLSGGSANTEGSGRYYTTVIETSKYYTQVNTMCRQMAYLLGINTFNVPGIGTLGSVNWNQASSLSQRFKLDSSAVIFYADSMDTVSESFSNDSMTSSLATQLNGYADQVNEIKFLLGQGNIASKLEGASDLTQSITGALGNAIGSENLGGVLSDIAENGVSTILNGGKLEFPKLWQDSRYDRSYSFDLKLRTPDNDNVSIFLNILVPYIHLLAFAMPQGMGGEAAVLGMHDDELDVNGYQAPFLCKAYCKGMLSVDMGMVSSMTTTKGATCQWNDDGLPTQLDVNLNIEDLYSKLHLNAATIAGQFTGVVSNTALMDYMCNMAGLNVLQEEAGRRTRMLAFLASGTLNMAEHAVFNRVGDDIARFKWWLYENL